MNKIDDFLEKSTKEILDFNLLKENNELIKLEKNK